jgi:hypothetical protein
MLMEVSRLHGSISKREKKLLVLLPTSTHENGRADVGVARRRNKVFCDRDLGCFKYRELGMYIHFGVCIQIHSARVYLSFSFRRGTAGRGRKAAAAAAEMPTSASFAHID